MKQKVNPIVAVLIGIAVMLGVGFASYKMFGTSATGSGKEVHIAPSNPNDPKYKGDPRLAGAGGGG